MTEDVEGDKARRRPGRRSSQPAMSTGTGRGRGSGRCRRTGARPGRALRYRRRARGRCCGWSRSSRTSAGRSTTCIGEGDFVAVRVPTTAGRPASSMGIPPTGRGGGVPLRPHPALPGRQGRRALERSRRHDAHAPARGYSRSACCRGRERLRVPAGRPRWTGRAHRSSMRSKHEPVVSLSTTRPDGAPHVRAAVVAVGRPVDRGVQQAPRPESAQPARRSRVMVAVGRADATFDVELIEAVAELHDTPALLPDEFVRKYASRAAEAGVGSPGLRRRVLAGDRDPSPALARLGRRRLGWLTSSGKAGSPCELARRRAEEAAEPAREVRLIGEADFGRDVGQRLTGEDPVAGGIETPSEDIAVRRNPECRAELPRHLGGPRTELGGKGRHRDGFEQAGVEDGARPLRKVGHWRLPGSERAVLRAARGCAP